MFYQSFGAGSIAASASASTLALVTGSIAIISATSSISIVVATIVPAAPIVITRGSSCGLLIASATVSCRRLVRVIIIVPMSTTGSLSVLRSRTRLFGWTVVFRVLFSNFLRQICFWKYCLVRWRLSSGRTLAGSP